MLFQTHRSYDKEMRHMISLFRRADRFLVGNQRQRDFLLPWLIVAGFDCRERIPIDVVPISSAAESPLPKKSKDARWRFVTGGVNWPWRKTERYLQALVSELAGYPGKPTELVVFSGDYLYSEYRQIPLSNLQKSPKKEAVFRQRSLLPYGEMKRFLREQASVGVELAEHNVEREYSQSFRAVEFLSCGLPVLYNHYSELAKDLAQYNAGWIVSDPREIADVVHEIMNDPTVWQEKSTNAFRLIDEKMHFAKTIKPVVAYLENQFRPARSAYSALLAPASGNKHLARYRRALGDLLHRGLYIGSSKAAQVTVGIVTRGDLYPSYHGAAVKVDRTAWGLSHHVDAVYIVTDNRKEYYSYKQGQLNTHRYPWWLSILGPPRLLVLARLYLAGVPLRNTPLYAPLRDSSFIFRILYLTKKHGINVFQAEFPAYARACLWAKGLFGGKTILVEHNVEYERLREQTPNLSNRSLSFLKRAEIALCNKVDIVITVSDNDKQQLASDGVDYRRLYTIPLGVDLEQFQDVIPIKLRTKFGIADDSPILVFHGHYGYPPNREAIEIMANEILPRLRERNVHATVLAIGANPPTEKLDDKIIFTGPVQKVAPLLAAADIAVVPLLQGSGTRMKILDYFAARLPVVSTPKGVEGIPVESNVEVVIAQNFEQFTESITKLLGDSEAAKRIAERGRSFAERLDWKEIAQQYLRLIEGR